MTETINKGPNNLLRRMREWHSMSQQQVADHIGTTPLSVSRWERGVVLPGPHFRRSLCALFQKNPYELGFVNLDESKRLGSPVAREALTNPQIHDIL